MSDSDHLVQLHHGIHQHSLSHGLGHAMHEMHVHGHGDADGQAGEDQQGQRHLEGEHVHHGHHGHGMHSNEENGTGGEEHDDDAGDEEGLDEADMHSDGGGHPGDQPVPLAARSQGSTQLTLSYQGEVYVFDTVPPEKVQAVLLLLGGREIPPGMSGVNVSSNHHHKGLTELPARMNMPQRLASLTRFREKRKERCYDKRIRYTVRKEVAQRMQRKKGQFASSRPSQEEGAAVVNWDGGQAPPGQPLGPGGVQPEVMCVHCGIGERSTPMMRRGPAGPRTLCNACGLMWANKGVLRDLSKNLPVAAGGQQQLMLHPQQMLQPPPAQLQLQLPGLQHSVENAPQAGDVHGSQQRDVDVQKNMASMVAAGGGPVLAAG